MSKPKEEEFLKKGRDYRDAAKESRKYRDRPMGNQYGDRLSSLDREVAARQALLDAAKELP